MRIFFFLLIFILLPETITLNIIYSSYYLYFKTLCSTCFLLCGIFSYFKSKTKRKYPIFILLGLSSSLIGDIIINTSIYNSFIIATLFFIFAHITFIVAFCSINKIKFINIILLMFIFIPFNLFVYNSTDIFDFKGLFPLISVYSFLISFMVVKALDIIRFFKLNKFYTFLSVVGPILFLISDIILLIDNFSIYSCEILSCFNHITYYSGQAFLALSLSKDLTKKNSKKVMQ